MRFRIKKKRIKEKKIHESEYDGYLKSQIKSMASKIKLNKVTPNALINNALNNYNEFQEEYLKQLPEMQRKIELSIGENRRLITDFYNDMKLLYDFSVKAKDRIQSKGIINKVKLIKFINIDLQKMMIKATKMRAKYKKYGGCNIDNFMVG